MSCRRSSRVPMSQPAPTPHWPREGPGIVDESLTGRLGTTRDERSARQGKVRNERSCIHCESGHRYPRWSRCNAGAPGVGTEGPLSIRACQALRPGAGGTFDVHSVDLEATLSLARRAVLPWVLASRSQDLTGRLARGREADLAFAAADRSGCSRGMNGAHHLHDWVVPGLIMRSGVSTILPAIGGDQGLAG